MVQWDSQPRTAWTHADVQACANACGARLLIAFTVYLPYRLGLVVGLVVP